MGAYERRIIISVLVVWVWLFVLFINASHGYDTKKSTVCEEVFRVVNLPHSKQACHGSMDIQLTDRVEVVTKTSIRYDVKNSNIRYSSKLLLSYSW